MRVLDLFCGAGGAGEGYRRAGFEVTGVDLVKRNYKPGDFIQADALCYLERYGADFDLIHASPPCQRYSRGTPNSLRGEHPDLVDATRELLHALGSDYVIENVVGAPLNNPVTLRWPMFHQPGSVLDVDGTPLTMLRARLFETNWPLEAPVENDIPPGAQIAGCYGGARRDKWEAKYVRKGGYVPSKQVLEALMGIDWMTEYELFQAIPPSYTHYIGSMYVTQITR